MRSSSGGCGCDATWRRKRRRRPPPPPPPPPTARAARRNVPPQSWRLMLCAAAALIAASRCDPQTQNSSTVAALEQQQPPPLPPPLPLSATSLKLQQQPSVQPMQQPASQSSKLLHEIKCRNFTVGIQTQLGGEFTSPNYPNFYPTDLVCSRLIEAPPGHYIKLGFRDLFSIEDSGNDCDTDKIEIRDGRYGYSKILAHYCGNKFPPDVVSSDRSMWLRFISDSSIAMPGFKAVYEFKRQKELKPIPPFECRFNVTAPQPLQLLHQSSPTSRLMQLQADATPSADADQTGGAAAVAAAATATAAEQTARASQQPLKSGIYSGLIKNSDVPEQLQNYTKQHNVSLECIWNITVMPGWKIYLTFSNYELSKPNDCDSNFIEIYEENLTEENQTVKFCGTRTEPQQSKSNVFNIRHHALPSATPSKFEIVYTAFRDKGAEGCNASAEFDCDDGTCIHESLRCDGQVNCKYRYDEASEPGPCIGPGESTNPFFETEHMVIILVVFMTLVIAMTASIVVSCWGKIQERRRRKQEYHLRKSREISVDEHIDKLSNQAIYTNNNNNNNTHTHSAVSVASQQHERCNNLNASAALAAANLALASSQLDFDAGVAAAYHAATAAGSLRAANKAAAAGTKAARGGANANNSSLSLAKKHKSLEQLNVGALAAAQQHRANQLTRHQQLEQLQFLQHQQQRALSAAAAAAANCRRLTSSSSTMSLATGGNLNPQGNHNWQQQQLAALRAQQSLFANNPHSLALAQHQHQYAQLQLAAAAQQRQQQRHATMMPHSASSHAMAAAAAAANWHQQAPARQLQFQQPPQSRKPMLAANSLYGTVATAPPQLLNGSTANLSSSLSCCYKLVDADAQAANMPLPHAPPAPPAPSAAASSGAAHQQQQATLPHQAFSEQQAILHARAAQYPPPPAHSLSYPQRSGGPPQPHSFIARLPSEAPPPPLVDSRRAAFKVSRLEQSQLTAASDNLASQASNAHKVAASAPSTSQPHQRQQQQPPPPLFDDPSTESDATFDIINSIGGTPIAFAKPKPPPQMAACLRQARVGYRGVGCEQAFGSVGAGGQSHALSNADRRLRSESALLLLHQQSSDLTNEDDDDYEEEEELAGNVGAGAGVGDDQDDDDDDDNDCELERVASQLRQRTAQLRTAASAAGAASSRSDAGAADDNPAVASGGGARRSTSRSSLASLRQLQQQATGEQCTCAAQGEQ